MKKFLRYHQSRHEVDVQANVFHVSYDGVAATNSCGRSFEVFSGKFENCRVVYPLAIGIAEKGFSALVKAKKVMKRTLIELKRSGIRIRFFVLDHPKRCGMYHLSSSIKIGRAVGSVSNVNAFHLIYCGGSQDQALTEATSQFCKGNSSTLLTQPTDLPSILRSLSCDPHPSL